MNKLLSALLAGAAALALSGVAVAADQSQPGAEPAQQSQTPNQGAQPGSDQGGMTKSENQPGSDISAKEQDYLAALKKCESLSGDQKQQCVDAAKKKSGEM
jgi:hypothetical protein